jgi:hypothetical protein
MTVAGATTFATTGATGIVAGTCGTELITFEKGRVTSGVEPDAAGATGVEDEAMGTSACLGDGMSTGDVELDRDGVWGTETNGEEASEERVGLGAINSIKRESSRRL